ncbi:DUF2309 domain-containing protein [Haloarchaeobius iranensis]|uniref:Probable inorganic carbon transporter subunit DabA n=1 Tax=Haloarchaeobius iranensis TaxID=996166 RepID=A0A1G9ZLV2_9EURY|nr:DUF2309 domain-containing protein [Haloarchaeobius iranensis]SDN22462.1 hypothetical protein SAMN05192554_12133 [Haloarchaeobius iranensis]
MSTESAIRDSIDEAATTVGSRWPVHSFVTANPLSGFEHRPFGEAVEEAATLLGGRGLPSARTLATALERGQIDREILADELAEAGYDDSPEAILDRMRDGGDAENGDADTATDRVDRVLTKWLSAFLDEGSAHWSMPNREAGFYAAFRGMAEYDGDIPSEGVVADLPESPFEAIESVLSSYPDAQWVPILEEQLAALPGWTGFIKRRAEDGGVWQSTYPISLEGYLAVRLALLDAIDADIEPDPDITADNPADDPAQVFLRAWEATYRDDLVGTVAARSRSMDDSEKTGRPDIQLVFCIDTRSEIIRRHIEATGDYETHGYAGFFGIPMEYRGYDADVSVDACPPILDPQHHVVDYPTDDDTHARHDRWSGIRAAADEVIEILEANAATAYGYVETAGSGYGLSLAARTLVPGRVHDVVDAAAELVPDEREFCEPLVHHQHTYAGDLPVGLTHEEKVEYAGTAFELMGFEEFGRLVVFTGHASETANNPYDASLDCGACAGNPGGPSARVLANICNDEAVKADLRERGFEIPDDTIFVAGQHNTTTDEVELFAGDVPESHADDLDRLRADLTVAREDATAERAEALGADGSSGVSETERRAADWAETRPEWGLAGNAGFVIGPRELTSGCDLDGRAFLHSYDWSTDPHGDALEAILTGPMVVTQWINAQYYFSTVDNAVYGSGSKATQNPVGNVGVYQGNGGDLLTGLPLQSLMTADDEPYHQPLRLSTVVHAPVERVTEVLADHENLTQLLDNDWLSLTVVDPTREHRVFHYEESLEWVPEPERTEAAPEIPSAQAVADD